jgi:hypothetical protein
MEHPRDSVGSPRSCIPVRPSISDPAEGRRD